MYQKILTRFTTLFAGVKIPAFLISLNGRVIGLQKKTSMFKQRDLDCMLEWKESTMGVTRKSFKRKRRLFCFVMLHLFQRHQIVEFRKQSSFCR